MLGVSEAAWWNGCIYGVIGVGEGVMAWVFRVGVGRGVISHIIEVLHEGYYWYTVIMRCDRFMCLKEREKRRKTVRDWVNIIMPPCEFSITQAAYTKRHSIHTAHLVVSRVAIENYPYVFKMETHTHWITNVAPVYTEGRRDLLWHALSTLTNII